MSSSNTYPYPSRTQKIQGRYGFALVGNDLCLVQFTSSASSVPQMYEAHIFRHTFVSLFSYMQTSTIPGKCILQLFDNNKDEESSDPYSIPLCHFESDTGIVFVSQDVMARYVQLKDLLCPGIGRDVQRRPVSFRSHSIKTGERPSGASIPFSSMNL
ncbi:hypothetical protein Clacol_004793 [Clathrus columnatus]|uniref:Uncharacterized protein n=1 Tax=Clathrus columnatus TaxID=1419009 RepID=A0AAV5ADJ5_9AGAM|nr:hypothetical protein Clacol_004793 [Clathrus columnatus]